MNPRIRILPLVLLLAIPSTLSAQGFAIGGRAGTLGFGAEAAIGLTDNVAIRGGLGSYIFQPDGDFDEITYTVTPPSLVGTLGVDFYPTGGSFRFMAGLMFRKGDFEGQSGDLSQAGGVELGDNEYDEAGTLHATLASKSTAPFVGLGFGHHTKGGFGLFLDLGVAFMGDPDVGLTAQGPIASVQGIQQDLDKEAQKVEDDVGSYLNYWPILSLGVKIPLG